MEHTLATKLSAKVSHGRDDPWLTGLESDKTAFGSLSLPLIQTENLLPLPEAVGSKESLLCEMYIDPLWQARKDWAGGIGNVCSVLLLIIEYLLALARGGVQIM